jgi:heme oxygenase (biliverdin-IX-beta and delta-forming)
MSLHTNASGKKLFVQGVPGSSALKAATASLHLEVERALALPGSIRTLSDYKNWLTGFFTMYRPLEDRLDGFTDWSEWGIALESLGHSKALARDLAALECDSAHLALAPQDSLPRIETFGQAFGASYVMEGSKLGGRFILRDLAGKLGPQIEGADAFFSGHGENTGRMWNSFVASLDRFSSERPEEFPEVVEGAKATFAAIRVWMTPLAPSEPE